MNAVSNEDIAHMFEEIADLLEIEDASPFRVRAYRTAAGTLQGLGREVRDMRAAGEALTDLPGIGKDLAGKIVEALDTGRMTALEQLHLEIPASLEALLRLPGLGPKRVRALHEQLAVNDLDDLRVAVESGKLRTLRGFGEKTEQRLNEVLSARREKKVRVQRVHARPHAQALEARLGRVAGVHAVRVAGSYRRGRDHVGDLDLLVAAADVMPVMESFVHYGPVVQVTAQGPTRASVLLADGLQVDLRLVAPESFGAALHYFTGSKPHNIQIRRLGQQRGLKINEYGVFRGDTRVAGDSEESVFAAVGLPFIPPELREDQGEIEAARTGALPQLVTLSDLRGDLHSHTTASDGRADLKSMALAARARGLEFLAVTDHATVSAPMMNERRLLAQAEAIDRLNEELDGITLLKGVEVDILEDGGLALPDAALAGLDVVVASVHAHFDLSRRKQTSRQLRALEHRAVTILGHPGGRFLPERDGYPIDMAAIVRRARDRGCFLELNSQPKRLDLNETYCRLARDEGVLVSIDSDAHGPDDFSNLELGITQARRGWLEKKNVLNTRPLGELRALLRKARR